MTYRKWIQMSDKRVSQLADMMAQHIIYDRTMKALLIAQALRQHYGSHLADIDPKTGYHRPK